MKKIQFQHRKKNTIQEQNKGAATTELALIAPLLIILVLGTIDVGQYVNASESVGIASRVGARKAAKQSTQSVNDIKSEVESYLSQAFPNVSNEAWNGAVDVSVKDSDGTDVGSDLGSIESGSSISIEVSLEYGAVRWMTGAGYLNGNTIKSTTTMRKE